MERRIRKGAIRRVENIGAYRYEAKGLPAGGYFYCSIKLDTGYDIYIPLYRKEPLKKNECDLEVDRIQVIPGIRVRRMNFISTSGFDFETDMYGMITGEDLYAVSG